MTFHSGCFAPLLGSGASVLCVNYSDRILLCVLCCVLIGRQLDQHHSKAFLTAASFCLKALRLTLTRQDYYFCFAAALWAVVIFAFGITHRVLAGKTICAFKISHCDKQKYSRADMFWRPDIFTHLSLDFEAVKEKLKQEHWPKGSMSSLVSRGLRGRGIEWVRVTRRPSFSGTGWSCSLKCLYF